MNEKLIIAWKEQRRGVPGVWVEGNLGDYSYSALVFAEHSKYPDFELKQSRISKLTIRNVIRDSIEDLPVFNWDRGLDIPTQDSESEAVVEFICENLAALVFGKS